MRSNFEYRVIRIGCRIPSITCFARIAIEYSGKRTKISSKNFRGNLLFLLDWKSLIASSRLVCRQDFADIIASVLLFVSFVENVLRTLFATLYIHKVNVCFSSEFAVRKHRNNSLTTSTKSICNKLTFPVELRSIVSKSLRLDCAFLMLFLHI